MELVEKVEAAERFRRMIEKADPSVSFHLIIDLSLKLTLKNRLTLKIREEVGAGWHPCRHRQLMSHQDNLNRRLDGRLRKLYYAHRTATGLAMPRPWLGSQSWAALAAYCHFALRQLAPDHEFSRAQIEELVRTAKTAPAGTEIRLISRLKLQVGYDTVAIVAEARPRLPLARLPLVPETSLCYGPFRLSFGSLPVPEVSGVMLPRGQYYVRVMRSGDRMQTVAGTKKIHDIFIDHKVPRDLRHQWPVVTDDRDQILWLPQLMTDPHLAGVNLGHQLIAEEV